LDNEIVTITKSDLELIQEHYKICEAYNLCIETEMNGFDYYLTGLGFPKAIKSPMWGDEKLEFEIDEFGDDCDSRFLNNLKLDIMTLKPYIEYKIINRTYRKLVSAYKEVRITIENRKSSKKKRREIAKDYDYYFMKVGRRDGYCCQGCNTVHGLTIDHINPLIEGGTNDLDNLQLLCKHCNGLKKDGKLVLYKNKTKDQDKLKEQ